MGKGGIQETSNWALTLATNAPVPSNADPLADPVGGAAQLTAVGAPDMVDLPLVLQMVVFTRDQRRQDDPLRDRRPVDARRRRDGNLAVRHDRVSHPAVDTRREQVDEFQTVRRARMLGLWVAGSGWISGFMVDLPREGGGDDDGCWMLGFGLGKELTLAPLLCWRAAR